MIKVTRSNIDTWPKWTAIATNMEVSGFGRTRKEALEMLKYALVSTIKAMKKEKI